MGSQTVCTARPVQNSLIALNTDVIILALTRLSSAELPVLNARLCYCSAVFPPLLFQIHMNPSQSTLTLEGDDIDRVDKAMQHISYLNSRQFPTPGIRRLKISSVVKYVPSAAITCRAWNDVSQLW